MINAILRRFELMSLSNSELPSGYKKLKFIYNPNQAYIDTGVDGGHFNKTYIKFILVSVLPTWDSIWGCRQRYDQLARGLHIYQPKMLFHLNHNSTDLTSTIPCSVDTLYEVTYNNGTFNINDDIVTYPAATFSNNYKCLLFGMNDVDGVSDSNYKRFARMKCYSFKMWQDETMVRDFVPARQLSDNKVGMYDKVEGKFYSSAHEGYEFQGSDETLTTEYIEEETTSDKITE
jgi:hypothetical protein